MTEQSEDGRRHAPATDRNREAILAVLTDILPPTGTVLEIASGTGQHGAYFAPQLRPRLWLPTDFDPENMASIAAWSADAATDTLLPPQVLDVCRPLWPVESAPPPQPVTAIMAANMVHIAPWGAAEGLFAGAGRLLPSEGVLCLYGPFMRDGQHTAPSNAEFDKWLRSRDATWGIRDLADLDRLAGDSGLNLTEIVPMPANNLSLVYRRV